MKAQGYIGLIEEPTTTTFTPRVGWKSSRRWTGPKQGIYQLAANLVAESGATMNITIEPKDANLATLTASFDRLEGDEPPEANDDGSMAEESTSWTLSGANQELSIWTHPQVKNLATNCPNEYAWLRKNLKIVQDKGTWNEVLAAYTDNSTCSIAVKTIMALMRDGVDSYQYSSYVLRRNATFRTDSAGQVYLQNVNRIFTKAQLQSFEGLPSELAFGVPDIQWLKGTPTVSYSNSKFTVDSEWVGADEWSTYLYFNAA